jgi:branched-chain amino acid transport system permease protein
MGVDYWLMLPLIWCFLVMQGTGQAHRCAPAIRSKGQFGWIMSTIALGIIFRTSPKHLGPRR